MVLRVVFSYWSCIWSRLYLLELISEEFPPVIIITNADAHEENYTVKELVGTVLMSGVFNIFKTQY